jgi:DNA-binding transcriptional LysR family regulator
MDLTAATINQLRAFEAVGRHGSFKLAAEELFVTQAALSHHVRHLERELGVQLVRRLHRRIELTHEGARLQADSGRALEALAAAVRVVRRPVEDEPLTVSVAPYFSARWLTPRLGRLWARHPRIDLLLHHAYQPADFTHDKVSAGISWGHGRWPEVESTLLLTGQLTPVCSPAYRERLGPRPADLLGHPLLCEFDPAHWRRWFQAAGVDGADRAEAVRIDDSHALRRAVLEGHGVALFFRGLIQEDLRTGQLAQPFELYVDPGSAYYLTRPRDTPMSAKLQAFTKWILEEVSMNPYA